MSEFPKRWKSAHLRSLTSKIGSGATPRGGKQAYKKNGIPLIRSMNVHFDGFHIDGLAYLDEQQAAALKAVTVQAGDVLLNITGASIGRVTQAPQEMHGARVNQHVCIIRPLNGVEPAFVARYLASPSMQDFVAGENYGVTRQALTKEMIDNITLPLPPPEEQKLIVSKLDSLFKRSKNAREQLARVSGLVERYKLAILAAAFRGDATAIWRSAHPDTCSNSFVGQEAGVTRKREGGSIAADSSTVIPLPRTWRATAVESIGEVILGRQRSPENHSGPHMHLYVRAANITWDGWDLSDVKRMNFDERDFKRFKLEPGDVLINEGSGSADEVGKPAIWNGEIKNCCFQNTLIAVRPRAATPEYLYFVFLNAALSRAFVDEARGVNIHHIGRAGLAQFVIPVPPSEEQQEIVRRIKAAFKVIDKLMAETSRAAQLIDRLDRAALAKAFRGELTGVNR